MTNNPSPGSFTKLLCEAPFRNLFAEFSSWRIDPYIRQMEKEKKKGRILPFVRGLRLSANLIYAIRGILSGTNLTANWGHLLDDSGAHCSCECDVIIHHLGDNGRWNGNEHPVMDFRFIEKNKVKAVVSCKSYIRSGDVDREYCKLMKPFVKKIWLFAECCGPRSAQSIQRKALKSGYKMFWYLYSWSKDAAPKPNALGWNEFVNEVKKLR